MAAVLAIDVPRTMVGLATITFAPVPAAGLYKVYVELSEVPDSSLSVLIKKNGSTIYTMASLTPGQGHAEFSVVSNLASSDVITIVPSSSAAIDNQLNTVRITCGVNTGAN